MTSLYALTDWAFWLQAIKFLAGVWLVWYLPGRFLLRQIKDLPSTAPAVALRWVLGLVFWTLLTYLLGWLKLRPVGPIICLVLAWYELRHHKIIFFWPNRQLWPVLLALVLGLLVQMPAVMTSGWKTSHGLELYFTNAEDGMMHASFIQNLVSQFPPQRPEAAGLALTNYHYLSDLATAELVRVFDLPILASFYQFLPPLISLLSGYLVFSLILAWTGRKRAGFLGLFFWYLGGDLGYLMSMLLHRDWRWFAAAIDNGADQFLNPPQTFAKLIFLAGLWLLNLYWRKNSSPAWWLAIFLLSSLIGFKIYFGLFILLALGLATLYRSLTHQAKLIEWLGLVLLGLVAIALILPTSQLTGGLKYSPLAWPKLLFKPDHLDWQWWWTQVNSIQIGNSWWRTGLLSSLGIGVSLIAILGTRIIGLMSLNLAALVSSKKTWWWFWWPTLLVFLGLGLNTTQDPGGLNTFNFLVVATVPLICFTAITLDQWLRFKSVWITVIVIGLLMVTPARSLRNSSHFLAALIKHDSAGRMTAAELDLATWLSLNTAPTAIIQSQFNSSKGNQGTYLSFFSHRQTYLTGRNILSTHGLTLPDRVTVLAQAAEAPNYTSLQSILKSTGIKYYYIENLPNQKDFIDKTDVADHTVFSNSAGWIIQL